MDHVVRIGAPCRIVPLLRRIYGRLDCPRYQTRRPEDGYAVRVLIVNYEMDDDSPVLAWQARVARELAGQVEKVVVLTERIGRRGGAPNMVVELFGRLPLGLPRRLGLPALYNFRVARLCRDHRIDVCFIHMASDWAYYLYPALRLRNIPILLWYAHGTVSRRLRLAHACATRVVTSTPEGFRIHSNKVRVIGQGVDADLFQPPAAPLASSGEIVTVGRVSRRKRIDLLLDVMDSLRRAGSAPPLTLRVIGPLLTADDRVYQQALDAQIERLGLREQVAFTGHVPLEQLPAVYQTAWLHLSVSKTGSLDKTVLEALACGCPVLTSNEAFRELLAGYPEFVIGDERPEAIAEQILALYQRRNTYDPATLRALIVGRHDLKSFALRLVEQMRELV
jgi:glycosyltransferase involved in cell wall biosynthesis